MASLTVKRFSGWTGYGFAWNEGGQEVFLHTSEVQGGVVRPGQVVEAFEVIETDKGLRAVDVLIGKFDLAHRIETEESPQVGGGFEATCAYMNRGTVGYCGRCGECGSDGQKDLLVETMDGWVWIYVEEKYGGDVYVDLYDYQLPEGEAAEEEWEWPNQFGYTHPTYLDPEAEPFIQLHWRTHVCEEV